MVMPELKLPEKPPVEFRASTVPAVPPLKEKFESVAVLFASPKPLPSVRMKNTSEPEAVPREEVFTVTFTTVSAEAPLGRSVRETAIAQTSKKNFLRFIFFFLQFIWFCDFMASLLRRELASDR